MLRSDEDKFYIKAKSQCLINYSDFNNYIGSIPKVNNQKDILILGIGSTNKYDDKGSSIWFAQLNFKQTQFLLINAEDKNLNNSFKLHDLVSTSTYRNGEPVRVDNSHNYAWKFGILNNSENDIDINVASYKNDLTDIPDRLRKETNALVDGDALLESESKSEPEYEIKQILPLIKEKKSNEDFLIYNGGLKLRCKYNYDDLKNYRYEPLYEIDNDFTYGDFNESHTPLEFWIDLGINIDNIIGISFCPITTTTESDSFKYRCTVKDYEIFISRDNINYQLLTKNTYDISKGKNENYLFYFKPEEVLFAPITFRYLKIKILNCYQKENYRYIGFGKLRIYTNTKNLYNKESDQSISNYKNNSFNQVSTQSEWNNKSKEDKIVLNKQASFDNPEINKIKNELNNFKIISNHNNIPIYEK